MLLPLLYNLRGQGLKVGAGEWLAFLQGLDAGLAESLEQLYFLGRATLIHSESNFDAYDLAFSATFKGVELPVPLKDALKDWLDQARGEQGDLPPATFESWEQLLEEFKKRLQEQKERHDGGNRWIGTRGTSAFGHSGKNPQGIRVGGESQGGRGAAAIAEDRKWAGYRTDLTLDIRDFQVALRQLRNLGREGEEKLDIEGSIQKTADNGGEIELDFKRERINRVHLVLLMDTGGTMDPHAALVSRLFSAASQLKTFKTFQAYHFHNAPYRHLYKDYRTGERIPTLKLLDQLTPKHRVIWVGDACMAPWELFGAGYYGHAEVSGMSMIQAITQRAPASVWFNPDPESGWDHPTIRGIGSVVPMFPLTLDGLRKGLRRLRRA